MTAFLLFGTNISRRNLILIVIGINFISDLTRMYSGSLQTPVIVDLAGKNEVSEVEGFASSVTQLITMIAQFIGSVLLLLMAYFSLVIINALTFLVTGLLYLNFGKNYHPKHDKDTNIAVNNQNFRTTMISSF